MVEEIAQLYVDLRDESGYDAPRHEQQRRKVGREGASESSQREEGGKEEWRVGMSSYVNVTAPIT